MTNYNERLDEILANLVNQIAANEQRLLNGNATREETINSDSGATMRAEKAILDWNNKQIEAYHNELTDNDKKVWIYADDLGERKAKAVEAVLDRLKAEYEEHLTVNKRDAISAIEAERNKLKDSN